MTLAQGMNRHRYVEAGGACGAEKAGVDGAGASQVLDHKLQTGFCSTGVIWQNVKGCSGIFTFLSQGKHQNLSKQSLVLLWERKLIIA